MLIEDYCRSLKDGNVSSVMIGHREIGTEVEIDKRTG